MNHQSNHNSTSLYELLKKEAEKIRELESSALNHLHKHQDKEGYKKCLQQKAKTLTQLPLLVLDYLDELPEEIQEDLMSRLEGISSRAEQALKLDSVFFMSLLLYPQDYQNGENNELENIIHNLKNRQGT